MDAFQSVIVLLLFSIYIQRIVTKRKEAKSS